MEKLNLSKKDKTIISNHLENDKFLPDFYRSKLFKNNNHPELIWNDKNYELNNHELPFQTIEVIDEPRVEKHIPDTQYEMFDFRGRQQSGWTNKLIWGDNKFIIPSLTYGPLRKEIEQQGGIKLIYIDPPFDVGSDFSMDINIGESEFTKKPNILEEIAYRDTWGEGANSYIAMIYERLLLMKNLLAIDGSIYVHCDFRMGSSIKLIMDEIFGPENFNNEIIWCYGESARGGKAISKQFARNHDSIFYFSRNKDKDFFNPYYEKKKYSIKKLPSHIKFDGQKYFKTAPRGHYTDDSIEKLRKEDRIYETKNSIRIKYFLENDKKYVYEENLIGSVWNIPDMMHLPSETLGYPTQKPMSILERIIKTSSNENDLIADFFCGSGTTLEVAERNNRKWIGSDLGKFAIHTSRKRMIKVQRDMKATENNYRAFEILNIGKYERKFYSEGGGQLRIKIQIILIKSKSLLI